MRKPRQPLPEQSLAITAEFSRRLTPAGTHLFRSGLVVLGAMALAVLVVAAWPDATPEWTPEDERFMRLGFFISP